MAMNLDGPHILFYACEIIAFLISISVHESAHALVADMNGDPTARQLGRVTLNPVRHIELFGTIIFPLISLVSGFGIFGWAKPTPVIGRNFRNYRMGDILTTLAGPASNFLLAGISLVLLVLIALVSHEGKAILDSLIYGQFQVSGSALVPFVLLLYVSIEINVILGIFNLIPVPPLDGSHVIRHFLPEPVLRLYDRMGMIGLILLFVVGGRFLGQIIEPFLRISNAMLLQLTR
ncbi:MAG: site-2 protease family protein [Acidobacteriaceae bacterium]